ncbi:helix-turn-helix transcriptional regulator [Listeria sp. FSL L7-1582]|uniref:helix-turn-helix domain-containing protein n=1 Tax=Listeria portnoyi TaxID=2713504 RepID=UPI00164D2590|nr:helix-turn-helix transcriptional regulator [Listeria portnoyi]MBC6310855.1 helix-turn-helix transcriptional regulator [Listeria portnoyi]
MANIIGERIKKLRKAKKLTQTELAKQINLTHVSISGYERGTRLPDTETLGKLSDVLETTTDYLLGRTNNPTSGEKDNVSVHYFEKENLTDEDLEYIETMIEALKRKTRDKNK